MELGGSPSSLEFPLADQKYNPFMYSEEDGLTCHYLGKAREHPCHSHCAQFLRFHM